MSNRLFPATLCALAFLLASGISHAQRVADQRYGLDAGQTPPLQIGLQYNATHTNGPPGGCGCFWMQGGGLQLNFAVHPRWSIAADLYGANAARINGTNERLSLFDYVAGPRYSHWNHTRYTPYGQILVGGTEFFSNYSLYGSGRNAFSAHTGGGLDIRVGRHVSLVPVEANWIFSREPNGVNTRQNNTRLSAGIVFRIAGN